MNTLLVTGGAGYIGSHTIIELVKDLDFNSLSIDNLSNSSITSHQQVELITGKKVGNYKLDLCHTNQLDAFFKDHSVKGIIHFAAYKAVGESVEKPLKYYHNNIASLVNLLEACKKHQIKNFIFSSSCSVYGNVEKLPVDENTPLPEAESPYAYTKQIGERIISDFCKVNPWFNAIALRYFNPVGAHTSGMNGELPINKPNNLVPLITGVAIGKYPKLTVFGGDYPTRDGTCVRDYIHVSDIARAHVLAIKYLLEQKNKNNFEVFNLGTGEGVTVLEAISAFEKISGVRLNYEIGARREGDVIAVYSDSAKAKKELGWECEFGIEEMMRSAWKWEIYQKENAL